MIFKRVFRQAVAAGVVNLPRHVGRGETIVRSRNSESRPGRPLPGDYINAVDTSRRLRIGRCPPPFLAILGSDGRVECHVEALVCRVRRSRERRYDYRKHTSSHLGARIFRAPRAKEDSEREREKTSWTRVKGEKSG